MRNEKSSISAVAQSRHQAAEKLPRVRAGHLHNARHPEHPSRAARRERHTSSGRCDESTAGRRAACRRHIAHRGERQGSTDENSAEACDRSAREFARPGQQGVRAIEETWEEDRAGAVLPARFK
eukprot:1995179-Prymnesium_polylepis.1